MTDGKRWRTWDEIEAEARVDGRLDEAQVAVERKRMRAEQRALRLAEIRRAQGFTQNDLAAAIGVSQRRVSAVERGVLEKTEIGTVFAYITALGGKVEIVARFENEQVTIADQMGSQGAESTGSRIAVVADTNADDARPAGERTATARPASGSDEQEALQATDRLAELAEAELVSNAPEVGGETAERERAQRLRADQLLVEAVTQEGLGGPRHRALEEALVSYAVPVLQHLLASGRVADKATMLGRPPSPKDTWMDFSAEDRQEFSMEMVVSALPAFTKAVFEDRRWTPGRGASLRTYFVNACLLQFARLQRQWLGDRRAVQPAGLEINASAYTSAPDPADTVIKQDEVRRLLSQIEDDQLRELLMLRGVGWTAKEAAHMVGLTPKAAEGRLARLRKRLEDEKPGTNPHAGRAVRHGGRTAAAAEISRGSNVDIGTAPQEPPKAEADQYFVGLLGASSVRSLSAAA
jgi:transcriptional regulator with XRE-family HTH domain